MPKHLRHSTFFLRASIRNRGVADHARRAPAVSEKYLGREGAQAFRAVDHS
jgi:hypothetical protein